MVRESPKFHFAQKVIYRLGGFNHADVILGLVVTLAVQRRQLEDARRADVRQFHLQLLAMAIERPEFQEVWGGPPAPPGVDKALVTYTNLVLNYFVMLYETGSAEDTEIRLHLKAMAQGEWMPAYWASTKGVWLAAYPGKRSGIVKLLDAELTGPIDQDTSQENSEA